MYTFVFLFSILVALGSAVHLPQIPQGFNSSTWAFWSNTESTLAVLPGLFNRSAFEAPWAGTSKDNSTMSIYKFLNTTQFVAYDAQFFDLLGSDAKVELVQALAYQSHEASCYLSDKKKLFFVEWGPPGGQNGTHPWHYMLDTTNNTLQRIQTDPPTVNIHGCTYFRGSMYVVTDGTDGETGYLARINPTTLKRETILNNYYGQPFDGFNDLDIDSSGNFYLTDSKAGYGRDILPYPNPTNPSLYFVNGTTLQPKVMHITTGNANGVAIGETSGVRTVYLPDSGVSEFKPVSFRNPYGQRAVWAYNMSSIAPILTNGRFFNNPISYFYDGIRVSRNGWVFAGAGDGVDVINPRTGLTIGTIRIGGGQSVAVNVAFGEHEMWIVGRGGVWHVSGIKEVLQRTW